MQESIHKTQLENYARYLSEMGYDVASKLLVYIGDVVEVISV
jgi:CRISPR/Cas system-associated exonuclease Cas4 (RecB family)